MDDTVHRVGAGSVVKKKVLFIYTSNSVRSQMAEGLLRILYPNRYDVYSAGIQPSYLHPHAIRVMQELGIDLSSQRSKSVDEFRGMEFDYVITLCNHSRATCPFYPAKGRFFHVGLEDPAPHKGTEEESLTVFRCVRDEIKEWIERTFSDTGNGED